MTPEELNNYSNFNFDDYNHLPLSVLEHFEWSSGNSQSLNYSNCNDDREYDYDEDEGS